MKHLLTLLFITIAGCLYGQSDRDLAEKAINENIIKSHIGFLASDELKGRDTPSEGLEVAAKYIESRFIEYGVQMAPGMDSYFQSVPMKTVRPATEGKLVLGNSELTLKEDFIVMEGSNLSMESSYVFVDYGMEKDLKAKKIEGKIVVALCGDGIGDNPYQWFSQSIKKRERVKALGGIGLVEMYNSSQLPWNMLVQYFFGEQTVLDQSSITHLWVNRSTSMMEKNQGDVSIMIRGMEVVKFNSQNVVGYVPGTSETLKEEFVVYSAHYDHVGIGKADASGDSIYNGARDNAVGTVTVLAAAKSLAEQPTKRSGLFVLFTGEEKGLLGSQFFVENAPIDLKNMVFCFNSDNGGYNDTSKATIIGLGRTTAKEMIVQACNEFGLEAIDDPVPEQGLFDRSDNVRFAAKGVPAPTFSMGVTAFDEEIMKYYHKPADSPSSLDYSYLEKFFRSYIYASRLIGNGETTPFWIEGDKYYEAGVELYKKE